MGKSCFISAFTHLFLIPDTPRYFSFLLPVLLLPLCLFGLPLLY